MIIPVLGQTTALRAVPIVSIRSHCVANSNGFSGKLTGLVFQLSTPDAIQSPPVYQAMACGPIPPVSPYSSAAWRTAATVDCTIKSIREIALIAPATSGQNGHQELTQAEVDARLAALLKHPRTIVPERMKLRVKSLTVPLGSPFKADVELMSGELFTPIHVDQYGAYGLIDDHTTGEAKIVREEGDVKTIEIVPRELESVDIKVSVFYKDNAFSEQTLHLNVVPSSKGLKRFSLIDGIPPLRIDMVLAAEERDREDFLNPTLSYEGSIYTIRPTMKQLNFTIDQPEHDPIISVDKWGKIKALHIGKATIKAEYAGFTQEVKVNVYSKQDAPMNWLQTHPPQK